MMSDETKSDAIEATEDQQEDNFTKNTVEVEDCGTLKKKITVTIYRDKIDAKRDEMFGELGTSAQVPGFRIGRAPKRLLEKRFGKEVSQDVRNSLIGESVGEAIEESELKTLGEPDIKLDEIELPDTGDLSFSFEVEVAPEFDLPELKGIEVKKVVSEVDDAKVDEYIQNLREGRASYEKTDEAAAEGDGIIAAAKITGDGIEFETPRVHLRVAPGAVEGLPLVDLAKDLAGKKVGDVVTVKVTAPEVHANEDWKGKELSVELTVHEVSRRTLPEVDDAFVSTIGFETMKEFRDFIAARLNEQVESQTKQNMRQQICDHLLKSTDFELPAGVAARHTHSILQRQFVNLMQHGIPREKIEENQAELLASAEEQAKNDLKLSFILGNILEDMDVKVTDDEINSRIASMAMQQGRRPERMRQELAADGTIRQIAISIQEEKAIDKLLEDAKVEGITAEEAEKLAKDKDAADKPKAKKAAKKSVKKAAKKDDDKKSDAKPAVKATVKKTAKKSDDDKKPAAKKAVKKATKKADDKPKAKAAKKTAKKPSKKSE
ncbi:MAG: trigger factor [Phycisphaerae bacterium]|nr:trigger factor [Phycisphaerae bacterium]